MMSRISCLLAGLVLVFLHFQAPAQGIRPRQTLKHDGSVDVVAFSPDGKTLAAGCRDGRIYFWQLGAEPKARHAEIPRGRFVTLAFAPDSLSLASTSTDAVVRVWSVATGEEKRRIDGPPTPIFTSAVYAPDGKTLATAELGGGMRLWATNGDDVRRVKLPEGRIRGLAYTPDHKSLAVGISYGQPSTDPALRRGIQLLDPATGSVQRVLDGQAASILIAPDGRSLAGWPDAQCLRLWELASGQERLRLPGKFVSVAFSTDGRLLAAADKETSVVRVWDLAAQKEIARLDGHESDIASLAFSPDGKTLASGSGDFTVCLWAVADFPRRADAPAVKLTGADLDRLWEDLGSDDATKAFTALGTLAIAPEAMPFLKTNAVRPLVDPRKVTQLIGQLDADKFEAREQATAELEKLGALVGAALKQAQDTRPSLEMQIRLDRLLEKLDLNTLGPSQIRAIRAVEALELAGTPGAHAALREIAREQPATLAGQDARATVERLGRQSAKP